MTWQFSRDLDWMKDAACVGLDGDLFFDGCRGRPAPLTELPCSACPVRDECGAFAESSGWSPVGVWGGLNRVGARCA